MVVVRVGIFGEGRLDRAKRNPASSSASLQEADSCSFDSKACWCPLRPSKDRESPSRGSCLLVKHTYSPAAPPDLTPQEAEVMGKAWLHLQMGDKGVKEHQTLCNRPVLILVFP